MFIEESDVIEFKIYYKKTGRNYTSYSEKDFVDLKLDDKEKATFKSLSVKMKELNWGLYNDLQEEAVNVDGAGNRRFNFKKYKENRLKKLLVSWDAQKPNVEGKMAPVIINEKTILSLAPEIAEVILNTYDSLSILSEEEEKK